MDAGGATPQWHIDDAGGDGTPRGRGYTRRSFDPPLHHDRDGGRSAGPSEGRRIYGGADSQGKETLDDDEDETEGEDGSDLEVRMVAPGAPAPRHRRRILAGVSSCMAAPRAAQPSADGMRAHSFLRCLCPAPKGGFRFRRR